MTTRKKLLEKRTTSRSKVPEWDNSAAVDAFITELDHPLKSAMEAIRGIILKASPQISEGIKWNAPSFYCRVWFATFDLRNRNFIQVIFHAGAKAKAPNAAPIEIVDKTGLLKWLGPDRCIARFDNLEDVKAKKADLDSILKQWVKQLPADSAKV